MSSLSLPFDIYNIYNAQQLTNKEVTVHTWLPLELMSLSASMEPASSFLTVLSTLKNFSDDSASAKAGET